MRAVGTFAELLAEAARRLIDPNPEVRELHVQEWRALRELPSVAREGLPRLSDFTGLEAPEGFVYFVVVVFERFPTKLDDFAILAGANDRKLAARLALELQAEVWLL